MINKKTIIFGISGQDGSYLAKLLIDKKYKVFGYSRNFSNNKNLKRLNIDKKVIILKFDDLHKIKSKILDINPVQIYFLSGQSSVAYSFNNPIETYESNTIFLFELLEFCRKEKIKASIYNACSTDCFGNSLNKVFDERSKFNPISPYGKSKANSFWLTKYYRENFNLKCCSGILSNHESPLRGKRFVFKKILLYLNNFSPKKTLNLGNVNIYREWGWAPDYVKAIYLITRKKVKEDYIVSTGKIYKLKDIIYKLFSIKKINKKYLKENCKSFKRSFEIKKIKCSIKKIRKELKWKPEISIDQMIQKLIKDELF